MSINNPAALARTGYGDARGIESLKVSAGKDPKAVVREAAKQFESLFMQQLLKSMRESSQATGMLDNEATKLGSEMLDTQWAGKLSGMPGGLSDVIARQLERQMGMNPGPIPKHESANRTPVNPLKPNAEVKIPQQSALGFVQQHKAAAASAEAASGIPASFMIAQAAHETGWGRKEIRHSDGTPAHNLFGIKAGSNWNGPTADVMTTEYVNGVARKVVQKFRAYSSYAESFADYAKLMKTNPRYEQVLAAGGNAHGFAQGLQRAGYATDPAYAEKLSRVINTTLRLQRSATA
ncbi:MAG TPA: flagellar assembly peptidoglycan hydrolase FlgJ [Ideonella sp.]|uniref:flagellar assembly peptidoglycan hydrolase FlgJ n=1 Tax=Ideonella sp. TaxID=1929293 RepID=UPI002E2F2B86|nr:flagellar assembly peptidoglycan hydrolase FlgJ [Ideonella sp.]HEX5685345.1 flagellar assembly peptidoglycan hydrolase FlgJ [Ideonella sp.]